MRRLLAATTLVTMLLLPGMAHAATTAASACSVSPSTTPQVPTVTVTVTNVPAIGVQVKEITTTGYVAYINILYPDVAGGTTATAQIPGTFVGVNTVQLFSITDATHNNGAFHYRYHAGGTCSSTVTAA